MGLGLVSWAVPQRVSTSRERSSPRGGFPELARRETARRRRADTRQRRSKGRHGPGRPGARPVGRLAVDIREVAPPDPAMPRSRGCPLRAGRIRSNPNELTSTANVGIAPMTNKKLLRPILPSCLVGRLRCCGQGCSRPAIPSCDENATTPATAPRSSPTRWRVWSASSNALCVTPAGGCMCLARSSPWRSGGRAWSQGGARGSLGPAQPAVRTARAGAWVSRVAGRPARTGGPGPGRRPTGRPGRSARRCSPSSRP